MAGLIPIYILAIVFVVVGIAMALIARSTYRQSKRGEYGAAILIAGALSAGSCIGSAVILVLLTMVHL